MVAGVGGGGGQSLSQLDLLFYLLVMDRRKMGKLLKSPGFLMHWCGNGS